MPAVRFTTPRATVVLVAFVASAALLFARIASVPVAPVAPASPVAPTATVLFDRYCGNCHDFEAVAAPLRGAADRAGLQAKLEEFLRRHGEASDTDDRLIVAYLLK